VIQDTEGNLYGTTYYGGSSSCGVVFKVFTGNTVTPRVDRETVLYSFTCGADGAYPYAGLVLRGGNLYGTTLGGGSSGYGVVYEVPSTGGSETVLHSFTGGSDGGYPYGGLAQAPDRRAKHPQVALYGAATDYGANGYGTVFSILPNGTFKTLTSFNYSDGGYPFGGAICGAITRYCKALFGATEEGGTYGYGTVYKVANGTETVLHNFEDSGSDGGYPSYGYLVENDNGTLYGTTKEGGTYGYGTVYKVYATGTETVLYNFTGGSDGGYPLGCLATKPAGRHHHWGEGYVLYGTTQSGGASGYGTVFQVIVNTKQETVLHSFSYSSDGAYPFAGPVVESGDGRSRNLYGVTFEGGSGGYGTVWEMVFNKNSY
jgi:uncharacterized repeat protein (TIGR03803 family)